MPVVVDRSTRYAVQFSREAQADLRSIKPFNRASIIATLAELEYQAEVETHQRKPLAAPLDALPSATWEARVGDYRAPYCIERHETESRTVIVLRVILKGTSSTREALSRAKPR